MNAMPNDIQYFPLDTIRLSPMNPRQTHDADEIEALAQSIAVAGLIQPLACHLAEDGAPEAVDGGRRLAALRHLRSQGSALGDCSEPDWGRIPCVTTPDHMRAQSWAGAAAASFIPLSPAQEIRAYAAMADQGSSPEIVARAFAVTALRVRQMLRLANLATATLDELAAGRITLDVAKALTLCPSQPREMELLDTAIRQGWDARDLRRALADNVVPATDRRAVFVGLDAYVAAGGTVVEDLFGDHSMLQDAALLDALFRDRLTAAAERIAGDWKWAEPIFDTPYLPYEVTNGLSRVYRNRAVLPEADTEEYDRLADLANADVLDADGQAALDALQARMDGDWTDAQYATCGVFVFVDRDGQLQWDGAYQRKADRQPDPAPEATGSDDDAFAPAPKPTPQNAVQDFKRIAHAAAQTAALDHHDTLLFLLAFQMEQGMVGFAKPLAIELAPPQITPEKDSGLTLDARLDAPERNYGGPDAAAFEAFVAQGKKHRNAVLTRYLARCLESAEISDFQRALLTGFAPAPRAIWTPDAANCFSRLPVATLDAIWADLVPPDKVEVLDPPFATLKKGQKAAELEKLFTSADYRELLGLDRAENAAIDAWMPVEMRGAEG